MPSRFRRTAAATDLAKGTLLEVLKARSLSRQAAHLAHSQAGKRSLCRSKQRIGTIGANNSPKSMQKLNAESNSTRNTIMSEISNPPLIHGQSFASSPC